MSQADLPDAAPLPEPAPLVFERLRVEHYLGIAHPGFSIDVISPGVNIVFGPNGIGKSTCAAAMRTLLWPEARHKPIDRVSATVRCAGETFDIDLAAGTVAPNTSGADAALRLLPAKDCADRYCLAFQDLIQSIDKPLAAELQRESAGGYDLARACSSLGYQQAVKTAPVEKKRLEIASEKLKEIRAREAALARDESALVAQRRRRDAAHQAAGDAALYRQLESYIEARAAALEAARALRALGRRAARGTGTEVDDADRYALQQQQALSELRDAKQRLRAGWAGLRTSGLARMTLADIDFAELSERLTAIRQAETDLSAAKSAASRETEAERQVRRKIATGTIERDAADNLDSAALATVRELMREADRLSGKREALDAIRAMWDRPASPADIVRLSSAEQVLAAWLSSPPAPVATHDSPPAPTILAAAAALVACIVLASHAILWLALLIPVVAAVWLAVRPAMRTSTDSPPDERAALQAQFERLDVLKPETWAQADVQRRLANVRGELRGLEIDRDKAVRWSAFEDRIAALDADFAAFERRCAEALPRLGLEPALALNVGSPLALLCEDLAAWRRADVALRQAQADIETCVRAGDLRIASFNVVLAKFGWSAIVDAAGAASAATALQSAERTRRIATSEIATARNDMKRCVRALRDARQSSRLLYGRAGIAPGDRVGLQAFVDLRQTCDLRRREFDEQRGAARQILPQLAQRLAPTDSAPPRSHVRRFIRKAAPGLLGAKIEDVRRRREAAEGQAATEALVHDEITRTQDRIEAARRGHDLESAIADEQDARDALAEARRKALRLSAGFALGRYVAAELRTRDLPDVFQRASRLLTDFTAGEWELDFDDGEPAQFRAKETETGAMRRLDELSSGTRIQLLIAVRLGYIEAQERGIKPPIVVDEALANSDDARAMAIAADLLGGVARGRQLFYLTAQRDELEKWKMLAAEKGAAVNVIDLSRIRNRMAAARTPRPARTAFIAAEIVSPPAAGSNMLEYAEILDAPGFSPRDGEGSIDLCWLTDSPDTVFALRKRGIAKWGQIVRQIGRFVDDGILSQAEAARMSSRARLLSELAGNWKLGRPPAVDFGSVIASGAVSSVHSDRVRSLLETVSGDAAELIRRLQCGDVPGFQKRKLADLRDYLSDNGWIVGDQPLPMGELQERLYDSAAADIKSGLLVEAQIFELLGLLPADETDSSQGAADD